MALKSDPAVEPATGSQTKLRMVRTTPETPASSRRLIAGGAVALVVLAGAFAAGELPRWRREQALQSAADVAATAAPIVSVAIARSAAPESERLLPGTALPLQEAKLFGRVTGYVKERLADIGDRVEEGQLLAVIDSPDVDDQYLQAKANLEQARATLKLAQANATLAKTVLARTLSIRSRGAGIVSEEEIEQQRATVGTTDASVENARAAILVNEAALQRFRDLQAFEKIIAPFPGVITSRHIDLGDLVSADSTNRELFHLMRTDVLRVFVNVPQVFATAVKVGQSATIQRREDPTVAHPGKVTRTADALDPATRTLLTEVQVPNPNNALRPGMYLQVKFSFEREVVPVMVPSSTLATRSGGPRVAVMDADKRVHYRDVKLGRDFGAEVEVLAGLKPGETVVIHPGDDLPEGQTVNPLSTP